MGKERKRAKVFVRHRKRSDDLPVEAGMIRAFVFDLDGTLVETEELKALSYARAATELRLDLNEGEVAAAFADLVGLSRQEVAVGLMRRFELEEAARARTAEFGVGTSWQAYVRIRLGIYEEMIGDPKLILGHRYLHNIALLRSVRREGYPTALATQSHRQQALRVLGILELAYEFDVVVTRDDVEHGKPDPEIPDGTTAETRLPGSRLSVRGATVPALSAHGHGYAGERCLSGGVSRLPLSILRSVDLQGLKLLTEPP